ncbi:hypothetical protein QYF36_008705 [Acer negundo]|nr:hypothetical protein QYF36_008705 [Acer negundo]
MVASWRVSRLRNMTLDNYQNRVTESVAETIKEQISVRFLEPLFQANNIPLPPGRQVYDVLERMVEGNPVNLQFLSQMYSSLETFGAQSQFYIQARAALCVRLSNQMNSGASIEKSGRGQEARFRPWRRGKGSEDKDTKVDWFVFMLRCLSFSELQLLLLVDRSRPAVSTEPVPVVRRRQIGIEEQLFSRGMSPTSHYVPFRSPASDPLLERPHDCTSLINHLAN